MKELITFETAKLAKEKGFNWKTLDYFELSLDDHNIRKYQSESFESASPPIPYDWNLNTNQWSSPTQSLLQKWLREVHGILVWAEPEYDFVEETIRYNQWTGIPSKGLFAGTIEHLHHITYESALEVSLQKGLTLIK